MDGLREYNFDGLVGPTHNYAGLAHGNVASSAHKNQPSRPRQAALEGLAKMRAVAAMGVGQCVLPPLCRPRFDFLRHLGFAGNDGELLAAAAADPPLLAAAWSAASMWVANAATVSPAADCGDGRLHLTPANLATTLHRSLEAESTARILRHLFGEARRFAVHGPLAGGAALADEGAANHTRLCREVGAAGLEIFAFGRDALDDSRPAPRRFPARQTLQACQAIARRHQLDPARVLFVQQDPQAIDAGVFHNDVISVGHENVLLCHELAFVDGPRFVRAVRERFESACGGPLHVVEFRQRELPLGDAVRSYFFNSQLLTRPDGGMTLLCPEDCREVAAARRAVEWLLAEDNPVDQVAHMPLRQSMRNGGGPACLRLRVVLNQDDAAALRGRIVFDSALDGQLVDWVQRRYREQLVPDDLRDPHLADEVREALQELAGILQLPPDLLLETDGLPCAP